MIMQLLIQANCISSKDHALSQLPAFTSNVPFNREGQLENKFIFFLKFIGLLLEDNVIITQGLLHRGFIDTVIDSCGVTESRDLYIKGHTDGQLRAAKIKEAENL